MVMRSGYPLGYLQYVAAGYNIHSVSAGNNIINDRSNMQEDIIRIPAASTLYFMHTKTPSHTVPAYRSLEGSG